LADLGIVASENRVWRLASIAGIFASHHRRKGKAGKLCPPVHDDLLAVVDEKGRVRHDFTATAPNEKWLTDITEHWTGEGKLYLCAIKDCYSNKIVGYSIDSRMKSSLAASALRNAIALRSPDGTIVHSDRGSQFRSKKAMRILKNNDLVGSMGRVASAGDNAAKESFFSLLQTREELRLAIVTWIETKYNRRRRQRALGKLTPVEFEMIYVAADAV
ncbi:IS3 family transposase, partial [bacterium]